MKRATNPNSPVKCRPQTETGDATNKRQLERDQEQTQQQHQHKQQDQPFYCPTDETDLTIGDQQQVSLLDPRESTGGRQQPLSVKGTTFTFAANMIGAKKTDNGDQAHQQQAKKQSGQKKNILAAGDVADQDLELNSHSRPPARSAKCWILIILMGILLALTLVVIILLLTKTPDDSDTCPNINQPFQASSYRLFATKTLYTTALNYLSLVPLNAANSPTPTAASLVSISPDSQNVDASGQQPILTKSNQVIHYDRSSIYRPHFFWHNETLEGIHTRLTGPDYGCQAKQLHYYGRHAARYPSQREIERMSKAFQAIKKRIDLIISPSTVPEGRSENTNSTKPPCFDPLLQFSNWRFFAQSNQANLITPSGALETQYISWRFKNLFPDLFDASQTKISIGTTDKIRTAQTAVNFLQQLTNYNLDVCPLKDFPSGDADAITSNSCYKNLISKYKMPQLSFHKSPCASSIDKGVNFKLNRAALTDWITQSVSKSLKLDSTRNPLTYEEMKALYDLCKYETAITGFSSIWCSLFTVQQMKFIEYMEDLNTFKKVAYGDNRQSQSACLLTKFLINHLDQYKGETIPEQQSRFYFTHSQVIQKMIAASISLGGEAAYRDYELKLKSRDVPTKRGWQTSLLSPFSANIAFILYSCPSRVAAKNSDPATNNQAPNQFDVSKRHSRLVVALNEQPMRMDVHDPTATEAHIDLPVELFYSSARFTRDKQCNLDDICVGESENITDDQSNEEDEDDYEGHGSSST